MMPSLTPPLLFAMALTLVGANSPEVTDLKQDVADVKSFLINKLAPDVEANYKSVQETRPRQSVPNSGFHLVGPGLILVNFV